MQKQVEWDAWQANMLVNSQVESTKKKQKDIDGIDLDPELCWRTWAEMFRHFMAYLYRTSHTSHIRHKCLLSEWDRLTQKLLCLDCL
jgi:hypothetical protein